MSENALLRNGRLAIALQAVLGTIFIYASIHKIADPPDFAHQVYNYKVTPGALINLVAIYLPWIELLAGLALIAGIYHRGAAAIVGVLLVVFTVLLAFNLLRGHPVDCACFAGSAAAREKTTPEMLAEMRWRVAEDAGMLLMVLYVFWVGPVAARAQRAGARQV
jgi:uncharacterized membrane protein YphA (DoxX/SURF4 family)